jgi:hypothetical protein
MMSQTTRYCTATQKGKGKQETRANEERLTDDGRMDLPVTARLTTASQNESS